MADFNGGIGVNKDKLSIDLKRFYLSYCDLDQHIYMVFRDFCESLKEKWASPDAYQKTKEWANLIQNIRTELGKEFSYVADKVEDAATIICRSHGDTYKRSYENIGVGADVSFGLYTFDEFLCLEAFSDGTIAMDVEEVKFILDLYREETNRVESWFDKLPSEISLYDKNGDIQRSYDIQKGKLKEDFSSAFRTINTELQSCMNQYITNLVAAKAKAESEIQG